MVYTVCRSGSGEYEEIGVIDRIDALHDVAAMAERGEIQRFTGRRTGDIFGWCLETDSSDGRERETGLLYQSPKYSGWMWLDIE